MPVPGGISRGDRSRWNRSLCSCPLQVYKSPGPERFARLCRKPQHSSLGSLQGPQTACSACRGSPVVLCTLPPALCGSLPPRPTMLLVPEDIPTSSLVLKNGSVPKARALSAALGASPAESPMRDHLDRQTDMAEMSTSGAGGSVSLEPPSKGCSSQDTWLPGP